MASKSIDNVRLVQPLLCGKVKGIERAFCSVINVMSAYAEAAEYKVFYVYDGACHCHCAEL